MHVFDGVDEWNDEVEARIKLLLKFLQPMNQYGVLLWHNNCEYIVPVRLSDTLGWIVKKRKKKGEVSLCLHWNDGRSCHWKACLCECKISAVVLEMWPEHSHGMGQHFSFFISL